jgi:hypothetical protein
VSTVEGPVVSASTVDPLLRAEGSWLRGPLRGSGGPLARGAVRLRRGALKRTGGALRGHYPRGIEGGRGS